MPEFRSAQWYSGADRNAYIHRAWMRRGLPGSAFEGRPQIAIANTASDLTPCNSHLNEVAEHVKRGIWEAGGVPLNLPVVSLGEAQVRPTAMLWPIWPRWPSRKCCALWRTGCPACERRDSVHGAASGHA
jgi:dihydroxyacid dehydratase/phosphogluconate dehydratase